jgi:hypothetical protein
MVEHTTDGVCLFDLSLLFIGEPDEGEIQATSQFDLVSENNDATGM